LLRHIQQAAHAITLPMIILQSTAIANAMQTPQFRPHINPVDLP
jgi:hypothetical protein